MSDQQAMPPNNLGQQFPEGTPVYDVHGDQVGTVSKHGLVGNTLILHKGLFFHRDVHIPLSAVHHSSANGIYLNISRDELQHERYAAPPATAEAGEGRLISQGVDVIERNPDLTSQGVDVIEQKPHTFTRGVDEIEQTPHTFTTGADTIERPPEEP